MHPTAQLPSGFVKSLNDLARAREKAARQKYLLDIGESLIMHLCAFVIGEYKRTGLMSLELEKSFLRNNKNLGLGIYIGWLRETSAFLNQEKSPSHLQQLLNGNNECLPLKTFIAQFTAVKNEVNTMGQTPLTEVVSKLQAAQGKTNLLSFFNTFVELRNRVAHPHKEVKGKMVSWPFSEDYFDAVNPGLEKALTACFELLNDVWQYKFFISQKSVNGHSLVAEDSKEATMVAELPDLEDGTRVLMNEEQRLLLADWKLLLKASEEAMQSIRQEEENARKMQSVEEFRQAVIAALDDQQISLDELRFFESLGRTKLSLNTQEVKEIILETAIKLGVEDPFPEVDKRYVQLLDESLLNKTFNEFILKLTGQQYGVSPDDFEKLIAERADVLNLSLEEVRKQAIIQFGKEELAAFTALQTARTWIMSMGVLNQGTGDSNYKITGSTHTFGTKEYWHRSAFESVEHFVKARLKHLEVEGGLKWETNQNNWQIGAMTSYCWCTAYPKDQPTKAILALHLSLYSDGSAAIGFLPDWKDYKKVEHFGLLQSITRKGLFQYVQTYRTDFEKFPDLLLWHQYDQIAYAPLLEVCQMYPWFFDFDYSFEQIQFVISTQTASAEPARITESFDIVFNLFNALVPDLIKDYETYLSYPDPMVYITKDYPDFLPTIADLFHSYRHPSADRKELEVKGDAHQGKQYIELTTKEKSLHVSLKARISADIPTQSLFYELHVTTAGHMQNTHHAGIDALLKEMASESFENAKVYYRKGVLWIRFQIDTSAPLPNSQLIRETDRFLKLYTNALTRAGIQSLGLVPRHTAFAELNSTIDQILDQLNIDLAASFTNKIQKDRNIAKKFMYWDYVVSSKVHGSHWIAWGIKAEQDKLQAGLTLYVSDIQRGEALYRQLETFATQHPEWTGGQEIHNWDDENGTTTQSYRLSRFRPVTDEAGLAEQMNDIRQQIQTLKEQFGRSFGFTGS